MRRARQRKGEGIIVSLLGNKHRPNSWVAIFVQYFFGMEKVIEITQQGADIER